MDDEYSSMHACSYASWSSLFVDKNYKYMIKSRVIPLPQNFITYLQSDGVIIPEGLRLSSVPSITQQNKSNTSCPEDSSSEYTSFSSLNDNISDAIQELGGKVFIKLNWSSPMVRRNYYKRNLFALI